MNSNIFDEHLSIIQQSLNEYLSHTFAWIRQKISHVINNTIRANGKRIYTKLLVLCLIFCTIYVYLYQSRTPDVVYVGPSMEIKKYLAYIITASCSSDRFNVTKGNLEVFFPNMFDIRCFVMVPLNDSRIHSGPVLIMKQFSSNLISFIDLWTFTIPEDSNFVDSQWSFVFEDDVNFNNPQKVFLNDYTNALKELMEHPEVRKDGFFYLGICGPSFLNDTQPLYSSNTRNSLYSQKASGFCMHASAITTKRARHFWTDISSYRPNLDLSLDKQLRDYSIRSKKFFYTFGSNFLFPPNTGHYGVAFQDRGRFSTMFKASI